MRRLWRDRVFVVSIVVAAVGLLLLVLSVSDGDTSVPVGGQVVALRDVHELRDVVGQRVSAEGARVQSVPADEGFWVTADGGDRAWVQIETTGEPVCRRARYASVVHRAGRGPRIVPGRRLVGA